MKGQKKILQEIINDIEHVLPQQLMIDHKNENIKLRSNHLLASNLSGGLGALFIRFVFQQLNINEHHIFRWRLENKYMQYLIFSHYAPGCMPKTIAVSDLIWGNNTSKSMEKVKELFSQNFFLKATLGHGSGRDNTFDRTSDFYNLWPFSQETYIQNEEWILQKKLTLKHEFRVHTFGRNIIHGLTFRTQGSNLLNSLSIASAENFLMKVLAKLPETIVHGTLIGWDIGVTVGDEYYIIESNFSGFHPKYCAGFQTSGYLDDKSFGPIICVWLNHYFSHFYSLSVTSIDDWLLKKFDFFKSYLYYLELLPYESFKKIINKADDDMITVVIYLNKNANLPLKTLVTYFQLVNLVHEYYIITDDESLIEIENLFLDNQQLTIFTEKTLCTKGQYRSFYKLSVEERKEICYDQTRKLIKTGFSITI